MNNTDAKAAYNASENWFFRFSDTENKYFIGNSYFSKIPIQPDALCIGNMEFLDFPTTKTASKANKP